MSTDEPGQTVNSQDAVIVISDRLIVQAQVDETDIGKVNIGQDVDISLDAYPEVNVKGKVEHIYYESKIVNNVTIYQVDIIPETVPSVFRSGMSATVNILEKAKNNVLIAPISAVKRTKDGNYVLVSQGENKKPVERKIELGISDDKNIEVVSGLTADDKIVIESKEKTQPNKRQATNPLLPMGGRRR